MAYFDLIDMISYKTAGYSGNRYLFYKGEPVLVEDKEDIRKFKDHKDIFFECDKDGNPIVKAKIDESKVLSYVKFNSSKVEINEIIEDNVSAKRENINVDDILDEVEKDIEDSTPKKITKKTTKTKKTFECEQCGQEFKNQTELNKHIKLHEEED